MCFFKIVLSNCKQLYWIPHNFAFSGKLRAEHLVQTLLSCAEHQRSRDRVVRASGNPRGDWYGDAPEMTGASALWAFIECM